MEVSSSAGLDPHGSMASTSLLAGAAAAGGGHDRIQAELRRPLLLPPFPLRARRRGRWSGHAGPTPCWPMADVREAPIPMENGIILLGTGRIPGSRCRRFSCIWLLQNPLGNPSPNSLICSLKKCQVTQLLSWWAKTDNFGPSYNSAGPSTQPKLSGPQVACEFQLLLTLCIYE